MTIDPQKFKATLPYASELFGIYQPLLGWKSKRTSALVRKLSDELIASTIDIMLQVRPEGEPIRVFRHPIDPSRLPPKKAPTWLRTECGLAFCKQAVHFFEQNGHTPQGAEWRTIVDQTNFEQLLSSIVNQPELHVTTDKPLARILQEEAIVSGVITHLATTAPNTIAEIVQLFQDFSGLLRAYADPLSDYDPAAQQALLSPIGLIQIFREYFFEFDSFLGPPVGHVWVSPGGSLEVFEIHTQRIVISGLQGVIAFVGGYDIHPHRWNWVDVHCRLIGGAALQVVELFHQRWNDHPAVALKSARKQLTWLLQQSLN